MSNEPSKSGKIMWGAVVEETETLDEESLTKQEYIPPKIIEEIEDLTPSSNTDDNNIEIITPSLNADDKEIEIITPSLNADDKEIEVNEVNDDVIEEAYKKLKSIFTKNIQNAMYKSMVECGHYLVEKFYGDYESAQKKRFTRTKSMSKLIAKLKHESKEGKAPSRVWVYDAVNLAIDNHLLENKILPSEYRQLGNSHKITLTYAPDNEIKKKLIEETIDKKYSVLKLRQRIREEKRNLDADYLSVEKEIPVEKLKTLNEEKLNQLKEKIQAEASTLRKKLEEQIKLYEANMAKIEDELKSQKS